MISSRGSTSCKGGWITTTFKIATSLSGPVWLLNAFYQLPITKEPVRTNFRRVHAKSRMQVSLFIFKAVLFLSGVTGEAGEVCVNHDWWRKICRKRKRAQMSIAVITKPRMWQEDVALAPQCHWRTEGFIFRRSVRCVFFQRRAHDVTFSYKIFFGGYDNRLEVF